MRICRMHKLEQGSVVLPEDTRSRRDVELFVQVSIAISLKRIADVLDGTAAGLCVTETLLGGRRVEP